MPTPTRPPQAGPLGVGDGRAAERDVDVGPVRGLRRADQFLGVARGDLSGLPSQVTRANATVPDRLICAAPPGPYGPADAFHPRHRGRLSQRGGHRGPDRDGPDGDPALGLEHDLVALTRRGREVVGQQSGGGCGVGVGQAEDGVKAVPADLLTPAKATRASSQIASTLQRCSKHHRARRAMAKPPRSVRERVSRSAPHRGRGQARRREPAGSICVHPPGVPARLAAGPLGLWEYWENRLLGV